MRTRIGVSGRRLSKTESKPATRLTEIRSFPALPVTVSTPTRRAAVLEELACTVLRCLREHGVVPLRELGQLLGCHRGGLGLPCLRSSVCEPAPLITLMPVDVVHGAASSVTESSHGMW